MLVKKQVIRKLTDEFYQVANYLIEDQLQAMQLIIDIATGYSLNEQESIFSIDNSYYENKFLKKLITLASQRGQQLNDQAHFRVLERAAIYLHEVRSFEVGGIANLLEISEDQVFQFIEISRLRMQKKIRPISDTSIN